MFCELGCWDLTALNAALGFIVAYPGFMHVLLPRPACTPCPSGNLALFQTIKMSIIVPIINTPTTESQRRTIATGSKVAPLSEIVHLPV
jgi:hypothetical protein